MAKEQHTKDIHRFSFSRLNTYKRCPMMHHYEYVEQIPTPGNEYTLSGSLLHEAIEKILKGEDPTETYQEWYDAVDTGLINLSRDQLEYTVNAYFSYWYQDYVKEDTVFVEETFRQDLGEDDYFVFKIDQAYRLHEMLTLRDTKSTQGPLKYTIENVQTNNQLLSYVKPVEIELNESVSAIEIDEVRLAKLDTEVPLIKNGKPSTSLDVLSLVTADLYRQELEKQNLLNEPKYANVLALLEQRGHPLFRRIKVQLSNRSLLDTIDEENNNLYIAASSDIKYRIKERDKCFMCPFKRLCELDEYKGSDTLRMQIIESISR